MSVHTTVSIAETKQDSKCNNVIESSIVPCYFDNISKTLAYRAAGSKYVLKKGKRKIANIPWQGDVGAVTLDLFTFPAIVFNLNINFPLLTQSWKFVLWKREGNSSSDKTSLRWHQIHPSKSTFKSFIEHIFVIYLVEPFLIPHPPVNLPQQKRYK